MNKFDRNLNEKRIRRKRAVKAGWKEPFEELPLETQKAFATTGEIRISQRSDKKHFGKSTKKRLYGHFSGYSQKGTTKKDLVERAIILSHDQK